ncbi:MAG: hypothetical protein P1P93_07260 [Gammaproteobacteria bacterium]|nr:hypothetical protein [Gammaproteobacteria bacterium]MDT8371892.1 hypothetical protein [Gammaproteobacteria bacterium]
MTNKAQELEVRTIMQGLEEFATFMSYQGNSSGLRILSVESVQQAQLYNSQPHSADIIPLTQRQHNPNQCQTVHRSLVFQDRQTH